MCLWWCSETRWHFLWHVCMMSHFRLIDTSSLRTVSSYLLSNPLWIIRIALLLGRALLTRPILHNGRKGDNKEKYAFWRNNVWFIKIRTIHNLSLWIILDNIIVWAPCILHFKGLGMRNLKYEMRICKKSHNKVTKPFF